MSRAVILAFALAACGGAQSASSTPPAGSPQRPVHADDPSCPMIVAGTAVTVEDTAGGAALVFVTTGDVAAVRARAAALAAMHDQHDGPPTAMGMMNGTPSTAAASDVPGGSRIAFTAEKPDDLAALQSELRMHAHHLAAGSCEMAM